MSPEGMAIVKGAPHAAGAARLMDIMASEKAQSAIFKATYRRPANLKVDVKALSGLPALPDIKIAEIDQNEAAAQRDAVIGIWKEILAAQ